MRNSLQNPSAAFFPTHPALLARAYEELPVEGESQGTCEICVSPLQEKQNKTEKHKYVSQKNSLLRNENTEKKTDQLNVFVVPGRFPKKKLYTFKYRCRLTENIREFSQRKQTACQQRSLQNRSFHSKPNVCQLSIHLSRDQRSVAQLLAMCFCPAELENGHFGQSSTI